MIQMTESKQIAVDHASQTKMQKYVFAEDDESIANLGAVLENMYENPERAVVRELVANAADAHVASNPGRPVEVHPPTSVSPIFSVRDYGPGLSEEDARALLCTYGASDPDKRRSNAYIGGFGIGAKSPYAISNTFTYSIWHGGIRQNWLCTKDENGMSQAALVSTEPSDQPNGVLVEVPMKTCPWGYDYRLAVLAFMREYENLKIMYNKNGLPFAKPKPLLSVPVTIDVDGEPLDTFVDLYGKEYKEYGGALYETALPAVHLGDYVYSVKQSIVADVKEDGRFNDMTAEDVYEACGLLDKCIVRLPTGYVHVAPSRESLRYSERTERVVKAAVAVVLTREFVSVAKTLALADDASVKEKRRRLLTLGIDPADATPLSTRYALLVAPDDTHQAPEYRVFRKFGERGARYVRYEPSVNYSVGDGRYTAVRGTWGLDDDGPVLERASQWARKTTGCNGVVVVLHGGLPEKRNAVTEIAKRAVGSMDDGECLIDTMHVVFLHRDYAEHHPWLVDGSVRVFDIDDVPATYDKSMYRSNKATASRKSANAEPVATGRPRTRLLRLAVSEGCYDGEKCYAPVRAADTPERGVYVVIGSDFHVDGPQGGDGRSAHIRWAANFPDLLKHGNPKPLAATFPAFVSTDSAGSALDVELYAIRRNDADMLPSGFVRLDDYIKRRFAEDARSGIIDVELLCRRVWEHKVDIKLSDDTRVRALASPAGRKTKAARLLKALRSYRPKPNDEDAQQAWTHLLTECFPYVVDIVSGHWRRDRLFMRSLVATPGALRRCPKRQSFARWFASYESLDTTVCGYSDFFSCQRVAGDAEFQNPYEEVLASAFAEIPHVAASLGTVNRVTSSRVVRHNGHPSFVSLTPKETLVYDPDAQLRALADACFGGDASMSKAFASYTKNNNNNKKETSND